ncbi:MAG: SAM-dependent chlorinase/fluorinase [Gemmataceae bacterium]|nr:SAM-dependent chlorinase/fluorinase [Gemmata sp.]MDW8198695.1 SAM-dependent chlorinase/fluorinase [Gemmataceae bacterium]
MALITLTTDFGRTSPYVAVMKGVILSLDPHATLIDLSHEIRPQNLRQASYFLGTATPYFPAGTIHLCVVDPGVGSSRAALCIEQAGRYFVGPDNGLFTHVLTQGPAIIHQLTNPQFWRTPTPSATFHGRDIFAPVAAHLSRGSQPAQFGPLLSQPVLLPLPTAVIQGRRWQGSVQFIDDFGNIITNIPAAQPLSQLVKVTIQNKPVGVLRWVRTYSEALPGQWIGLTSSDGFCEIAEVNGHAARSIGVEEGDTVEWEWQ